MEKLTVGYCSQCESPLYMYINGDRYRFKCTCEHRGVLKFVNDMMERDTNLLSESEILEHKLNCE